MRFPTQDSAVGRGIKTALQAIIGFFFGLIIVVWNVPGVPAVVNNYTQQNLGWVLLAVGVPAGLMSFAWNFYLREDVKKY